ncbi:MAG: nucleoside deaminase [Planctomycetota bacterium]
MSAQGKTISNRVCFDLPQWMGELAREKASELESDRDQMRFVIEMAHQNVDTDLGGPFAAAVFEIDSGQLVGAGVNRVMDQNCSVLHAEVVAIMTAQKQRNNYSLAGAGSPGCQLVTSCEPCAMCMGAIVWSGIKRLVCGAREEDAFAVGFDEGPKTEQWVSALELRGIEVKRDFLRDRARRVFTNYVESGGPIYNPE